MAAVHQTSKFFSLPAEIRNRIYTYALTVGSGGGTVFFVKPHRYRESIKKLHTVLTLLQTYRQIHDEAERIFFCIHKLEFQLCSNMPYDSTFPLLNATRKGAITSLKLREGVITDARGTFLRLLSFSCLKFLRIDLDLYSHCHVPQLKEDLKITDPFLIRYVKKMPRLEKICLPAPLWLRSGLLSPAEQHCGAILGELEARLNDALGSLAKPGMERLASGAFSEKSYINSVSNGTKIYLHGSSETEVYNLLMDAFRMRIEDEFVFRGHIARDTIYGGRGHSMLAFKRSSFMVVRTRRGPRSLF